MGCILKGGGGLYSRLAVGAVLMAAGPGSRIGGRPIGLLELGGVPLIRRQLIALSGAGIDELVVVLDGESAVLEPVVQAFPITLARHVAASTGAPVDDEAAAWRTGLAALGGKLDAVILAGANLPLLGTQDYSDLIGAYKKRPPGVDRVTPAVADRGAPPIILAAALRDALLAGAGASAFATHAWAVEHGRFRAAVTCVDDLEAFERETGHALRWPTASASDEMLGPALAGRPVTTAPA